eukprot:2974335-Pleurochrysis_carterae.AAC.2
MQRPRARADPLLLAERPGLLRRRRHAVGAQRVQCPAQQGHQARSAGLRPVAASRPARSCDRAPDRRRERVGHRVSRFHVAASRGQEVCHVRGREARAIQRR